MATPPQGRASQGRPDPSSAPKLGPAARAAGGTEQICPVCSYHHLCLELGRTATRPTAEASLAQQQMRQFGALLNQHYRTKRSVSDYTPLPHVTVNHLNALCRRVLSKTASALIHERVMMAQGLLSYSALSVAQVSYELGFEDASYLRAPFPQVHQHHARGIPTALICPVRRLQMGCAGVGGAQ